MENKETSGRIVMYVNCKRCVLSIKDKQSLIVRLEKREKGTNLSAEYGVSKQQISDIRVGIISILFFFVHVFDSIIRFRPEVILSIIVKCNVNHLGESDRNQKWQITFDQLD